MEERSSLRRGWGEGGGTESLCWCVGVPCPSRCASVRVGVSVSRCRCVGQNVSVCRCVGASEPESESVSRRVCQ
eukprot:2170314-Rhodomonas_salina.1